MSYLVLARKYRPQTFSEVVGQEHVTKTLSNAFLQDRVHHAFLFCGPRGCGKTTTARILAKAINCESGPTPTPCGTCQGCTSITDGSAVDYFEMDGASNRGIDSIRDLTDAVRYQPAVLRKKVYVIDEVHMLTTEAFNALLKTLEEPPPHVTFVMATTEPHKVPNTILSRCQRFDFKLVPSVQLSDHLLDIFKKEKIKIDDGSVNLLVRESGGSVRDALSLCDQLISYVGKDKIVESKVAEVLGVADRSLTRTIVEALAAGDAKICLEAVDAAIARGVDEVQIARAVVRYLRDLSVAQVAPESDKLIEGSPDERAQVKAQAASLDPSRVRQMFNLMLKTCDDLGRTEQPRLVLDLGLIEVAATTTLVPLGDLISRLQVMERRLSSSSGSVSGSSSGSARAPSSAAVQASASVQASAPVPAQAPAPASTPAPQSTQPSSALQAWESVCLALEKAGEFGLMTVYQTAKVLCFDNKTVRLGFPQDGLTSEIATDKEKIERMRVFVNQHTQKELKLEVVLLNAEEEANAVSILEDAKERAKDEMAARHEEAKDHPMTKMVLKTFGASIKEIKVNKNV